MLVVEEGKRRSAAPGSAPAVRVRDVRRSFAGREVLGGIALEVRAGEFVALLGPSGCGKSTLLRVLAGLDGQASGEISLPERKSVVFQEPRLLPWKRVWKNVALGLGSSASDARARARAALTEVGLGARSDAWPATLSGGEAQRVALGRALVRDPELLLLDEPFGALDALTRIKMHGLLAELWRRHQPAVVLVTHDVDEALLLADRAVVLSLPGEAGGSQIVADVPIDVPAPRRRRDRRFEELRHLLLRQLGVEPDEDAAPGEEPLTLGSGAHALPEGVRWAAGSGRG